MIVVELKLFARLALEKANITLKDDCTIEVMKI